MGVTSTIDVISRPIAWRARMALSRPRPGPETRMTTSFRPCDIALRAASWATIWAAYAVDLREPRKLHLPALDHAITWPLGSVIETIVLLKDASTFAKPEVTFFEPLALRTLMEPSSSFRRSSAVGCFATPPTISVGLVSATGVAAGAAAGAAADAAAPGAPSGFGALGALGAFSFFGALISSAMT